MRWAIIDESLSAFTADSVLAVVAATMDAPGAAAWTSHLAAMWLRVLRRPPHGDTIATAKHAAQLTDAALRAAPGHPVLTSRPPNDPRQHAGFSLGDHRSRIHPGDHEHPLMILRALAATARAVDDDVLDAFGFTFSDVLDLVLTHGHRTLSQLAGCWPPPDLTGRDPLQAPMVNDAEVAAVATAQAASDTGLAGLCRNPERAAAALQWLTRDARKVQVRPSAFTSPLGPVLFVRTADRAMGVPACLTLDVLTAAGEALLRRIGKRPAAPDRMQALTMAQAHALYTRKIVDRSAQLPLSEAPFIAGPRTMITVASGLTPAGLSRALNQAATRLREHASPADPSPGDASAVKVVVFGGPLTLGFQTVTDVVLVHLEELVEILDDAGGDWTAVEYFLEDLGHHTGYEAVEFIDLLDVWAAWRLYRRLGPARRDDEVAVLRVTPDDGDFTWDNAVGWEAPDAILAAAGLPEHRDWPVSRLTPPFGADLFTTPDGPMVLVGVDPPVVILLDAAEGQPYGLDPDVMFGLADGVRGGLAGHSDVAGQARLAHGVPLVIVMRLLGDGPAGAESDPWVRVAVDAAKARLEIGFGIGVLEQFIGDGTSGHDTLGAALHEMIRRIRVERGESAGSTLDAFLRGWRAGGPIATFITRSESLPRIAPVDSLPRTEAVRARAVRPVFDLIGRSDIAGTYTDAAAHQICQEHLIPAIEQRLREQLTGSTPGLLRQLAVRLNAARAGHFQRSRQVAYALTRPWAANWHDLARDTDAAMAVHAAEILFEFALTDPPRGGNPADPMVAAELAALTELLLIVAGLDQGHQHRLNGLRVEIHSDGLFTVEAPAASDAADQTVPGVDIEAYHQALRDQQIADAMQPATGSPLPADGGAARSPFRDNIRVPVDYRRIRDVLPPSLLAVDDHLTADRGAGMNGVTAVLGVAADWETSDDGIAVVAVADLITAAVSWSGLPEDQIRAALDTLTLTADLLPAMRNREYLDVERREYRLPLRPLPVVDQHVWILPWAVHTTQHLHAVYLDSGRLPYPAAAVSERTTNAVIEHRKAANLELEHEVRAILSALRLPHRFQFSQGELKKAGIPNPVGEIDLLIADAGSQRLWLCEIKDPIAAFSPATMRAHVGRFVRARNGYLVKLLKKADQIRQHPHEAAAACGVLENVDWRVIPLMITRLVEPTAYTDNPQVAFLLPRQLGQALADPDDPAPGPRR